MLLRVGHNQGASQGGQAQCEGSLEGAHHDFSDPSVRRLLQLHQALHTRRLVCKISQACQNQPDCLGALVPAEALAVSLWRCMSPKQLRASPVEPQP